MMDTLNSLKMSIMLKILKNSGLILLLLSLACSQPNKERGMAQNAFAQTSIVVLGTTQDAGSPQMACNKACCLEVEDNRMVSCLGVIDPKNHLSILIDASPDIVEQSRLLKEYASFPHFGIPNAIFLTHAHIGHYTGLMYLGKESMAADSLPVFCMPRMNRFLHQNGPWDLLIKEGRIKLVPLMNKQFIPLSDQLSIAPLLVPHRDEYSETVGYLIQGPNKLALYIPDIDKWDLWEENMLAWIKEVDYAILDGTFFDGDELPNRDMSEVPHPFVVESMDLFKTLSFNEKGKIIFSHLNHTNPLLDPESPQSTALEQEGYKIARLGMVLAL